MLELSSIKLKPRHFKNRKDRALIIRVNSFGKTIKIDGLLPKEEMEEAKNCRLKKASTYQDIGFSDAARKSSN
jgi:hypothetical protein